MAKIMIIDDDPDLVESMRVVLEAKQHKIEAASGGKDGMKKIREDKPDLVILDVMMATSSEGFEVARDIKKDAKLKDIPILMLTAIKDKTGLGFDNEAGDEDWLPVDDYCDKPLKPNELINKVEKLLGRK